VPPFLAMPFSPSAQLGEACVHVRGPSIFNQSRANGQANARCRQRRRPRRKRCSHHADCEKSAFRIRKCFLFAYFYLPLSRNELSGEGRF